MWFQKIRALPVTMKTIMEQQKDAQNLLDEEE